MEAKKQEDEQQQYRLTLQRWVRTAGKRDRIENLFRGCDPPYTLLRDFRPHLHLQPAAGAEPADVLRPNLLMIARRLNRLVLLLVVEVGRQRAARLTRDLLQQLD